jgi:uncharacterized protein (TIGR02391 family)
MVEMIQHLLSVFENMARNMNYNPNALYDGTSIRNIKNDLILLSNEIKTLHPFYSRELFYLKDTLFMQVGFVNTPTFGEIRGIIKALNNEIANGGNLGVWVYIHPAIIKVAQKLFVDGHYHKSVFSAFIEIEVRLKSIRRKCKPQEKELIGAKLMEAVFTNNDPTILEFQSRSNEDGQNVQKGFMQIFSGAMTGIRNLPAHGNSNIPKEDAVRKLMLASLLMYKVDDAVKFSNIAETSREGGE